MIVNHRIEKTGLNTVIYLFLDEQNTEFARELGQQNNNAQGNLQENANQYIKNKLPNIKRATVKVMAGGMLVATLAFGAAGLNGAKAAEGTPGNTQNVQIAKDIKADAFYAEAVTNLMEMGIITGYKDSTFKPDQTMTRAEFAVMVAKAMDIDLASAPKSDFTDAKDIWYSGAVGALAELDIINGYPDGTFKPNQTISRAEVAKILVLADETLNEDATTAIPFTDVKDGTWYKEFVTPLFTSGVAKGKTSTAFAPNDNVKRGEAATFLYRVMTLTEDNQTADTTGPTVTTASTTASIAAGATTTIVFNEKLSAASRAAVEGAIAGAVGGVAASDLGFAWADTTNTLTITNNHASAAATFANNVSLDISDEAGNTTTGATIINVTPETPADTTAPTVTTAATDGTIAAGATTTVVFSEKLSDASKTAVQTAITTGVTGVTGTDLGFAWDDATNTLTVTNNHATTAATFAASVTADITDAAGNTTTGATIINITPATPADTTAPTVTTAATAPTIAAGATTTVVFSEKLSDASKTAVQTAITTGVTGVTGTDLGFAWDDATNTLTVTNNHATTAATFAANVTADITDAAGNTTTGATIIQTA